MGEYPVRTRRTERFSTTRRHARTRSAFLRDDNPRSNIDSLCESTEWMIHEDLSSGPVYKREERGGGAEVGHGSFASIIRRFSEHAFPSIHSFIRTHRRHTSSRSNIETGRKILLGKMRLLPVHVVLQLHFYWTVPCRLILVVVFILRYLCKKKRNDEEMVCYTTRLTDRRNFSWETAGRFSLPPSRSLSLPPSLPPGNLLSFSCRQKCKCDSTRCSLHFT